jgi:acetolactate synthase-1/2/3 large subunit
LIAIGARFSDRVTSNVARFAPNAKVVHIDVDPAEINKNVLATASVIGDVKIALGRLLEILPEQKHTAWLRYIAETKTKYPLNYQKDGTLKPQYILERISALTRGKAVIVTEVGQHQMWTCQYVAFDEPRTFITSGGLGTMGYGLGASIGAQIGRPDKIVFNIAGDGCFRMNNVELATAVEYNLPVIITIFNNHSLGMVRQWQKLFYDKRFSHTTLAGGTDFVKLAEAHGALGFNITTPEEVDGIIEKAIAAKRPVVINFEIGPDDNVFPMVAPGAGLDEIVLD